MEVLSNFFRSVFTNEHPSYKISSIFSDICITEIEVASYYDKLSSLSSNKAPSPDCLHPQL